MTAAIDNVDLGHGASPIGHGMACAMDTTGPRPMAFPAGSTAQTKKRTHPMNRYAEHPEDVLAAWLEHHFAGGAALVTITLTDGGGTRAEGALMSVSHLGERVGYVSGGCLDADVATHCLEAMSDGKVRKLRYGAGSPFLDLPLPCGGAIELLIVPNADLQVMRRCHALLTARSPVRLGFMTSGDMMIDPQITADYVFSYRPKLRLRIAGRGGDAIALNRLARASGLPTLLQMPEQDFQYAAPGDDLSGILPMQVPSALPVVNDDPWTAVILSVHDPDWEDPLLRQALGGPAFFVGAVGSRRTHARRCDRLRALGVDEEKIVRIHSPVGLIGSMRDASFLAVSILAEVIDCWKQVCASYSPTRP
ncbi:XdhC family protein (plasmid) [Agrobacterium tumefaciens]|uniref:XdhC family protein n=1 Tax=Agrobacterium tumefaciens TaxID=358 RepID=A0AAJ4N872_AGRTU|nr:XdhC family protein [Agrobacterium tumefaciens]